ncbi:phosphatidylinositol-glycan biosynthesis class X protein [Phymastichus coffea]|uniref:phosphatidylinositol-glycan biosynthesis class X protein n=1 Tax=Phymastichus coffea TaxID=108790 RepID=UPI00273C0CCD|nr:phosphatidylinositol-glycan biosynthesis class X protein [Phymastichus coffea]
MTDNKSFVFFFVQIIFYVILLLNLLPFVTAISASIKSEVEGDGFHRNLKYYVNTGDFKNNSCHVAVFVRLPTSLYVNVDELADLRRLRKSTSCSEGEIDVELFAEKAYYQNVTICSRLSSTKITLEIPIHQRYRLASQNGQPVNVSIPKPKLLIGCKDRLKEHRVSKIQICWPCIEFSKKWREIPYRWEESNFVWRIPVGNTSKKLVITCITLFVTLCGAACVLSALYNSYQVPKDKKFKEH